MSEKKQSKIQYLLDLSLNPALIMRSYDQFYCFFKIILDPSPSDNY